MNDDGGRAFKHCEWTFRRSVLVRFPMTPGHSLMGAFRGEDVR